MSARRVVIVAFEGVQPLDVVGPAEVFHTAGRIQPPGYRVETVAPDPGPLVASSVKLQADRGITACRGAIDTLVVAGGTGVRDAADLRRRHSRHGPGARAGGRAPRPRGGARGGALFVRRPGGQSQFSAQLAAQAASREPLRELQGWIADHLDGDLSVPALARRACMSERNFARALRREVGMTPAAYVEAA